MNTLAFIFPFIAGACIGFLIGVLWGHKNDSTDREMLEYAAEIGKGMKCSKKP